MISTPYAYRGAKWKPAPVVWAKLGDVHHYVEPFAGSLATLLSRPQTQLPIVVETIGDVDCYIINFWRSIRRDPQAVGWHFVSPVAQIELQARHQWLRSQRGFCEIMLNDPDWYDPKAAAWWQWGMDLATDSSEWCGQKECIANTLPWSRTVAPLRRLTWDPLESTCRHASLSIL